MAWAGVPTGRFAANGVIAGVPISDGFKKQWEVMSGLKTAPPDCIWTVWVRPVTAPIYVNGATAAVPISSGRYNNVFRAALP